MEEISYDGQKSDPLDSAVLGDKLEVWLDDLLDLTENILTFMIGPEFTVTCPVSNADMESASSPGDNDISYLEDEIERLRQQMESIKSKRVKLV
jgi:hypothetical protein